MSQFKSNVVNSRGPYRVCTQHDTLSSRLQPRLSTSSVRRPGLQNLEVVKLANMSDLGME